MKYKTFRLGDVVTIKYGKSKVNVESKKGTVPIYGTGGFMGFANTYLYDRPSVLIGRKGTIDKVHYVDHPFWTVDTLFYTEINTDIVIPRYLYYALSLIDLSAYNEGTTVPSLRRDTLNRIELNLPDLDYQKAVLAMLGPLDRRRQLNAMLNKNLGA